MACPHGKAKLFGSYYTKLAIPGSDIDIVICNTNIQSREDEIELIHQIDYLLQTYSWVKESLVIDTATVPIIKFKILTADFELDIPHSEINVDLTIEHLDEMHQNPGIASRNLTLNLLNSYKELRYITLVLKRVLL